ncbi:MAG: TMEM175 family protein, partial [Streptococcaceae bacterium]|nr:TMEM175 family protein [Streptococcaceae bacterium]
MTKERFLNYTDAIVAIIATIMVLELPIPKEVSFSALREAASPFFAYFLSFTVIWIVWFNHHGLFSKVKKVNGKVYWYNG